MVIRWPRRHTSRALLRDGQPAEPEVSLFPCLVLLGENPCWGPAEGPNLSLVLAVAASPTPPGNHELTSPPITAATRNPAGNSCSSYGGCALPTPRMCRCSKRYARCKPAPARTSADWLVRCRCHLSCPLPRPPQRTEEMARRGLIRIRPHDVSSALRAHAC